MILCYNNIRESDGCELRPMSRTELGYTVDADGRNQQLDNAIKRVLSIKVILAWIMRGCVEEYRNYPIDEIVDFIEGEPQISGVPVHASSPELIHGLDTVDKNSGEKTVLYDICFYARLPGSEETIGLIINVEAQNNYYP